MDFSRFERPARETPGGLGFSSFIFVASISTGLENSDYFLRPTTKHRRKGSLHYRGVVPERGGLFWIT